MEQAQGEQQTKQIVGEYISIFANSIGYGIIKSVFLSQQVSVAKRAAAEKYHFLRFRPTLKIPFRT